MFRARLCSETRRSRRRKVRSGCIPGSISATFDMYCECAPLASQAARNQRSRLLAGRPGIGRGRLNRG